MSNLRFFEVAIATTGIVNALLVVVFIFHSKIGNLQANRVLGLLLLAFCLKLSFAYLDYNFRRWGIWSELVSTLGRASYMAFGPLLFIYLLTIIKKPLKLIYKSLIFVPVPLVFVAWIFHIRIHLIYYQLYFLVFIVISFIHLRKHFFSNGVANAFRSDMKHVIIIFTAFVFIWASVNALLFVRKLFVLEMSIIFTVTLYTTIYLLIKQYWFEKGNVKEPKKYRNSNLSIEEEENIVMRLSRLMEEERMYVDPEITLPKVADRLNVKVYKISQVINQKMNMTFNEYVNSFRIKEIKQALVSPDYQNTKILSIAFDYGFNSLSAFNTAFKKFTNYTPSQYRNEKVFSHPN